MFFWTVFAIASLDQLTKYFIRANMQLGKTWHILPGLFDFTYVHNYGAAFSVLQNRPQFLLVFTGVLTVAISAYAFRYSRTLPKAELLALAFIVGGGLGNWLDRALHGYVIDFLNIHILPVFNVADIAVCIGCALLAYSVLLQQKS